MRAILTIGVTGAPKDYRAELDISAAVMGNHFLTIKGDNRRLALGMSMEEMEWLGHVLLGEAARRRGAEAAHKVGGK